ncbi:MAG: hypothetical protein M3115_06500 [Thermoproteota archaeon]|nr:hypothetical protein [Thermoproteota archaeon]
MKKSTIIVAASAAAAVAIVSIFTLLYTGSIAELDVTDRAINNPTQSGDTKAIENPAPPEHPAFPSAGEQNMSSILAFNSTAPGAR